MYQLLKIEWFKIKGFVTFWILTGLFAVLLPLFNYQFSSGMMQMGGGAIPVSYGFPGVWSNFGFWASWFVFFIAFVVIILVTNEYRYRTNRQNIIDGWTRMQAFHAKCLLIITLAIVTTLYVGIWCIIFGAAYSNTGFTFFTQDIDKLFYFFILCLNYYGFAMMLSFLFRRSGLAIGIFMLYAFIFENIAKAYLNWQIKGSLPGNLLPLQTSDELLPFPLMRQAESLAYRGATPPGNSTYVIVSVVYIVLYYIIARYRLLKSDW